MASQKSVLITGCSAGGIGSSLAFSFAKRNHLVFATARNTSKIDPALSALPNVKILTLDTTSQESITAAVHAVSAQTNGTLSYLINNAGSGLVSPFLDTDLEDARRLFEVNFWGCLMCVQGFKEPLVKGRGTIVNVSSIAGIAPNPYESIYNASKAALSQFGETLRHELKPLGINVVTVAAGMVQSAWYSNSIPSLTLPKDSYYHSVTEQINAGVRGDSNKESGTNVDVFAEQVVSDVLSGKSGYVYRGALSTVVKWVGSVAPRWFMDKLCYDRAGLKALENAGKGA